MTVASMVECAGDDTGPRLELEGDCSKGLSPAAGELFPGQGPPCAQGPVPQRFNPEMRECGGPIFPHSSPPPCQAELCVPTTSRLAELPPRIRSWPSCAALPSSQKRRPPDSGDRRQPAGANPQREREGQWRDRRAYPRRQVNATARFKNNSDCRAGPTTFFQRHAKMSRPLQRSTLALVALVPGTWVGFSVPTTAFAFAQLYPSLECQFTTVSFFQEGTTVTQSVAGKNLLLPGNCLNVHFGGVRIRVFLNLQAWATPQIVEMTTSFPPMEGQPTGTEYAPRAGIPEAT